MTATCSGDCFVQLLIPAQQAFCMKRAREEDLLARVSALCQDADTVTVDMAVDEIREFGFEASVFWVCFP